MCKRVKDVFIVCLLSIAVLSMTACNQSSTQETVTTTEVVTDVSKETSVTNKTPEGVVDTIESAESELTESPEGVTDTIEPAESAEEPEGTIEPDESEPTESELTESSKNTSESVSAIATETPVMLNKTAQCIVVEPSQENIRNAVLELDPAYDTEKLDAFLNARYSEEECTGAPWFLCDILFAVKDDTSGNVYIVGHMTAASVFPVCNMTTGEEFDWGRIGELVSLTITSDENATYLNVAQDRGNLIRGYVLDLTNCVELVNTYARDTEEGVTDEQVYPEEYLKYANLHTVAVIK